MGGKWGDGGGGLRKKKNLNIRKYSVLYTFRVKLMVAAFLLLL